MSKKTLVNAIFANVTFLVGQLNLNVKNVTRCDMC
jgi:hypothetical protein